MKRSFLFRFLCFLSLSLVLTLPAFSADVKVDGKIKIFFETKKMSKAQADAIVAAGGEVTLRALISFSGGFLENNSSLGARVVDNLKFNFSALSFHIVDDQGNTLTSPTSVGIAGGYANGCANGKQDGNAGAGSMLWVYDGTAGKCPVYAYGGQLSGTTTMSGYFIPQLSSATDSVAWIIEVKFKMLNSDGFRVVCDNIEQDLSTGDASINLMGIRGGQPVSWPEHNGTTIADWLSAGPTRFEFGPAGGVIITKASEITSFKPLKDVYCPGSDSVRLRTTVKLPGTNNQSLYKYELQTANGTGVFTLNTPTVGQTVKLNGGYMTLSSFVGDVATLDMVIAPAHFQTLLASEGVSNGKLPLVFNVAHATDASDASTANSAVTVAILPKLYINAAAVRTDGNPLLNIGYNRVSGPVFDTIKDFNEYTQADLRLDCTVKPSGVAMNYACYNPTADGVSKPSKLYPYSDQGGTTYAPVSNSLALISATRVTLPREGAHYYNQILWNNGCVTHTDTVVIVPVKTIPAPVLVVNNLACANYSTDPTNMFNMVATTDPGNKPVEWQWVLRQENGNVDANGNPVLQTSSCLPNDPLTYKPADFGGGVILGSAVGTYNVQHTVVGGTMNMGKYTFTISGTNSTNSEFKITNAVDADVNLVPYPYSVYAGWVPTPDQSLQPVNSGALTAETFYFGSAKYVYVRYKNAEGTWSKWSTALTSNENPFDPLANCAPYTHTIGITTVNAKKCAGNVGHEALGTAVGVVGSCEVDTSMELNEAIAFYLTGYPAGWKGGDAITALNADDRIDWQMSTDDGSTWTTWGTTVGPLATTDVNFDWGGSNNADIPTIKSPTYIVTQSALFRAVWVNKSGIPRITGWGGDAAGNNIKPETVSVKRKTNIISGDINGYIDGVSIASDSKICVGNNLDLAINGMQSGATYRWEYIDENGSWAPYGTSPTASLSQIYIPKASEFNDPNDFTNLMENGIPHSFRVMVFYGNDSTETGVYKINVFYVEKLVIGANAFSPAKIDGRSYTAGVCAGTPIDLSTDVPVGWMGDFSFEYSDDGGRTFANAVSEGSSIAWNFGEPVKVKFTGYNKWNNRQVRIKTVFAQGNNSCVSYSDTVVLVVDTLIAGKITPDTICNNQTNVFTYTGQMTSAVWYKNIDKLEVIPNENGNTLSIAVPTVPTQTNEWIGIQASKVFGTAVPDTTVCMTDAGRIWVTSNPNIADGEGLLKECQVQLTALPTEMCVKAQDVIFTLGTPGAFSDFEYSTDGTTFATVPTADYDATDASTGGTIKLKKDFFVNATTADLEYTFKAKVDAVETAEAKVKIHPNPDFTAITIKAISAVCEGELLSLELEPNPLPVPTPSGSTLSFKWGLYNGATYDTIANDAVYSGATTSKLDIKTNANLDQKQYIAFIKATSPNSCSVQKASTTSTITVNAKPDTTDVITSVTSNTKSCENNKLTVSVVSKTPASNLSHTFAWFKGASATPIVSGTTIPGLTISDKADGSGSDLVFDASAALAANNATYKMALTIANTTTSCDTTIERSFTVSFAACGDDEILDNSAIAHTSANPIIFCENEVLSKLDIKPANLSGAGAGPVTKIELFHSTTKLATYTSVASVSNPSGNLSFDPTTLPAAITAGSHYYYAVVTRADWTDTYTDTIEYFIAKKADVSIAVTDLDNITECQGKDVSFGPITITPSGTDAAGVLIGRRLWYKTGSPDVFLASRTDNTYPITSVAATDAGTYGVKIIDSIIRSTTTVAATTRACYDTTAITTATLTVNPLPVLPTITMPANIAKCEGDDVTITATINPTAAASGTEWEYIWGFGSSHDAIASATNANSLTLKDLTSANQGQYYLRIAAKVTASACVDTTAWSTATGLQINPLPTFTVVSPSDITVCNREDASFTATASSSSSYNYTAVWKKADGSIISSGTDYDITGASANAATISSKLTVKNTKAAMSGNKFYCVFTAASSASCSKLDSTTQLSLTVNSRPDTTDVVTTNPKDYTGCSTKEWSLSASTANLPVGASSYTYQWFKGTTLLTDGADYSIVNNSNSGSTITAKSATAMAAGTNTYKIRVIVNATNSCPDTIERTATVILAACPDDEISSGGTVDSPTYDPVSPTQPIMVCANSEIEKIQITPGNLTAVNAAAIVSAVEIYHSTTLNASYTKVATLTTANYIYTPNATDGTDASGSHYYYACVKRSGAWADTYTDTIEYLLAPKPSLVWDVYFNDTAACQGTALDWTIKPTITGGTDQAAATIGNRIWYKDPAGANTLKATRTDNILPFTALILTDEADYSVKITASVERASVTVPTSKLNCYDTVTYGPKKLTVYKKALKPSSVAIAIDKTGGYCEGDTAKITSTIVPNPATYADGSTDANVSYKYVWYRTPVSGLKAEINGADTAKLHVNDLTVANNNNDKYELKVLAVTNNSCNDSTTSAQVTINVKAVPVIAISADPQNVTVCDKVLATFVAKANIASSDLATTTTWVWHREAKNGNITVITDGAEGGKYTITNPSSHYGSNLESKLEINKVAFATDNGAKYYCSINSSNSSNCSAKDTSAKAVLTIEELPELPIITTSLPTSTNICQDADGSIAAVVSASASGITQSYLWYSSATETGTYAYALTTATPTLTFKETPNATELSSATLGTTYYKLKVVVTTTATSCTDTITSAFAKVVIASCGSDVLHKDGDLAKATDSICSGATAVKVMLAVAAQENPSSIKWQVSYDGTAAGAGTWADAVTADGTNDCATATAGGSCAFTPAADKVANTSNTALKYIYYRVIVERPNFATETSNSFVYVVKPLPAKPAITTDLQDLAACKGASVSLDGVATVGSTHTLTYAWEHAEKAADAFAAISGQTAATYSIAALAYADTGRYRFIATATNEYSCTSSITSAVANVSMHALPEMPTLTAVNDEVCDDEDAHIAANPDPKGAAPVGSTYKFKWFGPDGTLLTHADSVIDFTPATIADAGTYKLRLINTTADGCADSLADFSVTLTVNPLPVIDWNDSSLAQTLGGAATASSYELCEGNTLVLTPKVSPVITGATATSNAIVYKWYADGNVLVDGTTSNGSIISGATTATLTIKDLVAADALTYNLEITASSPTCTTVHESKKVTLVVNAKPDASSAITTDLPASYVLCKGFAEDISIETAAAAAGLAYRYDWFENNVFQGSSASAKKFTVDADVLTVGDYTYKVNVILYNTTTSCSDTIASKECKLKVQACLPDDVAMAANGAYHPAATPSAGNWDNAKPIVICESDVTLGQGFILNAQDYANVDTVTTIVWEYATDTTAATVSWTEAKRCAYTATPYTPLTNCVYNPSLETPQVVAASKLFVRATISRKHSTDKYSDIYTYIVNKALPVASAISVSPTDTTVCEGKAATFVSSYTLPAYPALPDYPAVAEITVDTLAPDFVWKSVSTTNKVGNTANLTISSPTATDEYTFDITTRIRYHYNGKTLVCANTSTPVVTVKLNVDDKPNGGLIKDQGGNAFSDFCIAATNTSSTLSLSGTAPASATVLYWEVDTVSSFAGASSVRATIPSTTATTSVTADKTSTWLYMPDTKELSKTNYIRAVVKNGCCDSVFSAVYSLSFFNEATAVHIEPTDSAICVGKSIDISMKAGEKAYASNVLTWTRTDANKKDFTVSGAVSISDVIAPWTFVISNNVDTGWYSFRIAAMNTVCTDPVYSDTARIYVAPAIAPSTLEAKAVMSGTTDTVSAICLTSGDILLTIKGGLPTGASIARWSWTATYNDGTDDLTPQDLALKAGAAGDNLPYVLPETFFTKSGTYNFIPYVRSGSCDPTAQKAVSLKVYAQPAKAVIATNSPICSPYNVKVNATVNLPAGSKLIWDKTTDVVADGNADFTGSNTNLSFASGTAKDVSISDVYAPKVNTDTAYFMRVRNTVDVAGIKGCNVSVSDSIKIIVKMAPVSPILTSNADPVCAGEELQITADGFKGISVWEQKIESASPAVITNFNKEEDPAGSDKYVLSINPVDNSASSYTFTVKDSIPGCAVGSTPAILKVFVRSTPEAGDIKIADTAVCVGSPIVATATNFKPVSAFTRLVFQVSKDTTATPLVLEVTPADTVDANGVTSVSYSKTLPEGTYFVRYLVNNGTFACGEDASYWAKASVYEPTTFDYVTTGGHICQGSDVTIEFNYSNADSLFVYKGNVVPALGTKPDTAVALDITATTATTGKITFAPDATSNYVFVARNTAMTSGCGIGVSLAHQAILIEVDKKPAGGKLSIDGATDPKLSEASVGEAIKLILSNDTGTTRDLYTMPVSVAGVKGAVSAAGTSTSVNPNYSVALTGSHIDTSYFWVEVSSGICPEVYSDTVKVSVKFSDKLSIASYKPGSLTTPVSNFCETEDIHLQVEGDPARFGIMDNCSIEWERAKGAGSYVKIATPTYVAPDPGDGSCANYISIKESGLDSGSYKYRIVFKHNSNSGTPGANDTSAVGSIHIDHISVAVPIKADPTTLCNGMNANSAIGLVDPSGAALVGKIIDMNRSRDSLNWTKAEASKFNPTDYTNVYAAESQLPDSGYYRLIVQNGACPADTSAPILLTVLHEVKAGNITQPAIICYNSDVTFENTSSLREGDIVDWLYAADTALGWKSAIAEGLIVADASGMVPNKLTITDVKDGYFAKTIVGSSVCKKDTTEAMFARVYDTIVIATQAKNDTITLDGTASRVAEFSAQEGPAGLQYSVNGDAFENPAIATYQWEYSSDGLNFTAFASNGSLSADGYAGAKTKDLQLSYTYYNNKLTYSYRCVITNTCSSIYSDTVGIVGKQALNPGGLAGATKSGCFFIGDTAVYFNTPKATGGSQLAYRWTIAKSYDPSIPTAFTDTLFVEDWVANFPGSKVSYSPKGDSIYLIATPAAWQDFAANAYNQIHLFVTDENNIAPDSSKSVGISVCNAAKPVFTINSDTVCAGTNSNNIQIRGMGLLPADAASWAIMAKGQTAFYSLTDGETYMGSVFDFDNQALEISTVSAALDSAVIMATTHSHYSIKQDTVLYTVLRVDQPVAVKFISPEYDTVCEGNPIEFTAVLDRKTSIPSEVTWQWWGYVNPSVVGHGSPQSGTVKGDTIKGVMPMAEQARDSGMWILKVRNICNADFEQDTAYLKVDMVPTLSVQPTDQTVCSGNDVEIAATWKNFDSKTAIVWQKKLDATNWSDLVNNTNPAVGVQGATEVNPLKLSILAASRADSGVYRIKITSSSSCGLGQEWYSDEVTVTIDTVPLLTITPNPSLTIKMFSSSSFNVKINNASEGVAPNMPTYEWYIRVPGETDFATLQSWLGTNFDYNDSIAANTSKLDIKSAPITLDSTFFYCLVQNACGTNETDTVLLRVNDRFAVVDIEAPAICEHDTARITVTTNVAAGSVIWRVGKPIDATTYQWSDFIPGGDMDTVSTDTSGIQYILFIPDVSYFYNGYKFAAIFNDGIAGEDVVYSDTVALTVNRAVKFNCANPDITAISNSKTEVVIGSTTNGSSVLSYASAACGITPLDPDDGSYTYTFAEKKPLPNALYETKVTTNDKVISYTFTPAADTGVYKFYLSIANACGGDTAETTVRVLEKLVSSDLIVWTDTLNNPTPNVPTEKPKDPDKPWNDADNTLELTVCENHFIKLYVPISSGIADNSVWEVSTDGIAWQNAATFIPSSVVSDDTLIVNPVLISMNGYSFRLISEGATPELRDTSVVLKLSINPVNDVVATIRVSPNPAHENDAVTLTAELKDNAGNNINTASGYTYNWFKIERDASLSSLGSSATNTFSLGNVSLTNFDSTQYFCTIAGPCAEFETDTNLLRIYSELKVDWIVDYELNPDIDIDTMRNPPLNQIIGAYDHPTDVDKTGRAYYVSCMNEDGLIYLPATTLTGIVDQEHCHWIYSTDEGATWTEVVDGDGFFIVDRSLGLEIDPATAEMNGWLFRYIGKADVVNGVAAYEDSTSIIELKLSTKIKKGSITMNGCSDETYCAEHDYDFSLVPEVVGAHYDWFLSNADGETYAPVGGDSARYVHGTATHEDNGKKVMAVISNVCGNDTVYCTLKIETPDTVGVELLKDISICANEDAVFTASPKNGGDEPIYEWYVNDVLVSRGEIDSYTLSDVAVGDYEIKVKLISSASCVVDSIAADSVVANVHPVPSISVSAIKTELKVGDSTELHADVQITPMSDYTITWQPSELVKEPTKDSTSTVPMASNGTYTFVATVETEFGCKAIDSVKIIVKNNFTLDSIPTVVVVPPVIPDGKVDTLINVVFIGDEARIKVCPGNYAYLTLVTKGGTSPLSYTWTDVDVVFPEDYAPNYETTDSTFGFFLDGSITNFTCLITDATGATVTAKVFVEYYTPQRVMIETAPKMSLASYFEKQAIYYSAHPNHFSSFSFYKYINDKLVDEKASESNQYKTSYTYSTDENNWVFVEIVDTNGCKSYDSVQVNLIPLPNAMICDDPNYPNAGVIFPEFEVEIYNSWGQVIKPMNQGLGWDATKSDKAISSGTYYYKVKVPTLDGFTYINGAVTVFRKNK